MSNFADLANSIHGDSLTDRESLVIRYAAFLEEKRASETPWRYDLILKDMKSRILRQYKRDIKTRVENQFALQTKGVLLGGASPTASS